MSMRHSFEMECDHFGDMGDDDGNGEHDNSASSDADKDSIVSVFSFCVLIIDFGQLRSSCEPFSAVRVDGISINSC